MSSWIGSEGEPWTLERAVDALLDSARQAAPLGWVWIAGVLFPSLHFGLPSLSVFPGANPLEAMLVGGMIEPSDLLRAFEASAENFLAGLAVLWMMFRLMIGLARLASPEAWAQARGERSTPRLKTIWNAGKGLTLSCLGLWVQLFLMLWAGLFVCIPPLLVLGRPDGPWSDLPLVGPLLASPIVIVLLAYMLVLAVITQLAMQSLVNNRRGVASALVHAWRLLRHEPLAGLRAISVDLVLLAFEIAVTASVFFVLDSVRVRGPAPLIALAVAGFAGVTRAGYWARAYRALGGLVPEDGVPGLRGTEPGPEPPSAG